MLQPIQVDFGRGIASAMGNATESVKNIGDIARNYLATEERKKTRAEDVAFRDQQAETAKEQWGKNYLLQQAQDTRAQAQEGRAVNEAKILSNTRQALPVANQEVNAIMQNVVTPQQSDAILAAYNKNPRADVQGMVNKAQAQYNANPIMQKQMLQSMALSTGADEGVDAQGNKIFTNKEVDPVQMIAQRDKLVSGLDQQIAAEKLAKAQAAQFGATLSLQKQKLALDKKALEGKGEKFAPRYMSKIENGILIKNVAHSPDDYVSLAQQGYTPGVMSEAPGTGGKAQGGYKDTTNKSTVELLREEGGRGLLGGTSGADLVSAADAWKLAYPKAPKDAIINKMLSLSKQNYFSDAPDEAEMTKFLSIYK